MSKKAYNNPRNSKRQKAKRAKALGRTELLTEISHPRVAPAGPTSFPVKVTDAETRRLIDEALARRAM